MNFFNFHGNRNINIAVFSSFTGSTLHYLIKDIKEKKQLYYKVNLIVGNNVNSGTFDISQKENIPFYLITNDTNKTLKELRKHRISMILLLGYNKKVHKDIIKKYKKNIYNLHPSLLPKYKGMYGDSIHEKVIKDKQTKSGITIHRVNQNYDDGQIVSQSAINLKPNIKLDELRTEIKNLGNKSLSKFLINEYIKRNT